MMDALAPTQTTTQSARVVGRLVLGRAPSTLSQASRGHLHSWTPGHGDQVTQWQGKGVGKSQCVVFRGVMVGIVSYINTPYQYCRDSHPPRLRTSRAHGGCNSITVRPLSCLCLCVQLSWVLRWWCWETLRRLSSSKGGTSSRKVGLRRAHAADWWCSQGHAAIHCTVWGAGQSNSTV